MIRILKSLRCIWWWIAVPMAVGLFTWGPYIYLNAINRVFWPIWRFPFVPIAIFDSSAYFQWIGAALSGLDYGIHIRFFDLIIQILGQILPGSWSATEVWLLTLWASVTLGILLLARGIAAWSGLASSRSRWLSLLVWCSLILPLMPRPGVFTWHIPFYALGLICVWHAQHSLKRSKHLFGILWTLGALISTWVYPYFFVHLCIWLTVLWIIHFHERNPRIVRIAYGIGIVLTVPVVMIASPFLLRPELRLAFELQERVGMAFSRLPVLSNSLLLIVAWIGFVILVSYAYVGHPGAVRRIYAIAVGWFSLLASWLSNVFTGVYIHNDHFRAPAVIMSWISLAVVLRVVSEPYKPLERQEDSDGRVRSSIIAYLPPVFLAASLFMFFVYAFKKSYVFHGDVLNAVHASHWLTLVAGSAILVWFRMGCGRNKQKTALWPLTLFAVILGIAGRGYVFAIESKTYSAYVPYIQTIAWIRDNVPVHYGVCADPDRAEVFGSFSSRLAYPTYATAFLPKSDEEILNDLKIELGNYDAQAAGQEQVYIYTMESMRGTTCDQFTPWSRMFSAFGMSSATFDKISACPRSRIQAVHERIGGYMAFPHSNDEEFRRLCPVVIIAHDQSRFWSLPGDYQETKIDENFSVWRKAEILP